MAVVVASRRATPQFKELRTLGDINDEYGQNPWSFTNIAATGLQLVGGIATQYAWGAGLGKVLGLLPGFALPWMSPIVGMVLSGAVGVGIRYLINRWHARNLDLDGLTRAALEGSNDSSVSPKTQEQLRLIADNIARYQNILLALGEGELANTDKQLGQALNLINQIQAEKTRATELLNRSPAEIEQAKRIQTALKKETENLKTELKKKAQQLENQKRQVSALKTSVRNHRQQQHANAILGGQTELKRTVSLRPTNAVVAATPVLTRAKTVPIKNTKPIITTPQRNNVTTRSKSNSRHRSATRHDNNPKAQKPRPTNNEAAKPKTVAYVKHTNKK